MKTSIAVLFLMTCLVGAATPAGATSITYDVSGSSSLRTRTAFAPAPPGYDSIPFAPGSTLTLETFLAPGYVRVASSQFVIQGTIPAGLLGFLTVDAVGELSGGLGLVLGDAASLTGSIAWLEPATYSVDGTVSCTGIVCEVLGWTPGVPLPYDTLYMVMDTLPIDSPALGAWAIDSLSTPRTFDFLGVGCGYPDTCEEQIRVATSNSTSEWIQGLVLAGHEVPEPSLGVLLSPGALAALALRRRTSGTIRRHETC